MKKFLDNLAYMILLLIGILFVSFMLYLRDYMMIMIIPIASIITWALVRVFDL